jgi:hypothetical protein
MTPALDVERQHEPLELEIMAPGTYHGIVFDADVFAELAAKYNKLAGIHDAPVGVRVGHSDQQVLAQEDGDLALGWVKRLFVEGSGAAARLKASIVGVPSAIRQAINAGAYRKVSPAWYPRWELCEAEQNLKTGIKGITLAHVALLGMDVPRVRSLADLPKLLASEDEPVAQPSVQERLDRVTAELARVEASNADARRRLRELTHELRVRNDTGRMTMAEPARQTFRDQVDAQVERDGGDPNDGAARLAAARTVLRALQDAGEVTVPVQEYLDSLKSQTELGQVGQPGAWGRDRPLKTTTQDGEWGGLKPREWYSVFAEPEPTYGSSEAHRRADALAEERPDWVLDYTARARTEPLPAPLMEAFNRELSRFDPADGERVGKAMRAVAARSPAAWIPNYGTRGR